MYVCVCKAVTERQVLEAARAGAKTLHDLRRSLGVATECGRCARCAHQLLREVHGPQSSRDDSPRPAEVTEPAAA